MSSSDLHTIAVTELGDVNGGKKGIIYWRATGGGNFTNCTRVMGGGLSCGDFVVGNPLPLGTYSFDEFAH